MRLTKDWKYTISPCQKLKEQYYLFTKGITHFYHCLNFIMQVMMDDIIIIIEGWNFVCVKPIRFD